jgi:hypothetical protein
LNPDHEEELDRAQHEAREAFIRAKRIVHESRALLLKQSAPPAEEPVLKATPSPTSK